MPMKNNKGISMITLIVTIVCMIIFLGLAFNAGSRYIEESKTKEREALVTVISSAAERRQNDRYVAKDKEEIEQLIYSGYHISSGDFDKVYPSFENKSSIYEPGTWYILDANRAQGLGIVDSKEYLISDIKNTTAEDENKYIALVDYYTGNVELIKYLDFDESVVNNIKEEVCDHEYTVQTCMEPSICKKCGEIIPAYPHDYNIEEPTCTEAKVCRRCGYIADKALGHLYNTEVLSYNNNGHFNKCVRCDAMGNLREHENTYMQNDDVWTHDVKCSKCDWVLENQDCRKEVMPNDTVTHTVHCLDCGKTQGENHDDIKYRYVDKKLHMLYCVTCNSDLYLEDHIDVEKPYGICDKCNGVLELTDVPEIILLTMKNITDGAEDKYFAKYRDTIEIKIETSVILAEAPKVKLGNIRIDEKDFTQEDSLTWVANIDTADYKFDDGVMSIEVTAVRSLWGVNGNDVSSTTDGKYVTYDATKPIFRFLK